MTDIDVKVGDQNSGDQAQINQKQVSFNMKLKARRTLEGNIIISDHPDIDIVIMLDNMKVVVFSKDSFDDEIYQTQNRLMKYLFKKGIIVYDSVAGGNIYGSLEAKIQKSNQKYPIDDLMLMIIGKWIEEEKPSFLYQKSLKDTHIDDITNPDEAESTELGDVKAQTEKGSISINQARRYANGL